MSIYEIPLEGDVFNLFQYKDNPLLIINIADQCGFVNQLQDLEQLYQDKVLNCQVLAFPSTQFNQQLRSDTQMQSWCQIQKISYPVYKTVDVNGPNAHPLFQYLTSHARGIFGQKQILWNYTKFLVMPQETVIKRFGPRADIGKVVDYLRVSR